MRFYGILLFLFGSIIILSFWSFYFGELSNIVLQSNIIQMTILVVGMILSVFSGILIGLGMKIILNPPFWDQIIFFLKSSE